MDTELARSRRNLRRTDSKFGDHHISHKNSKWLENNLEDMDRRMKRMLKLIEEDADSLTKKAEIYFRRRPELISIVEEFYRMYRSLAERYDNITGDMRKGSSSDLQSQTSSGRRVVGFDVFLGSSGGGNSDVYHREGDESPCMTDSELESDDNSSVNTYPGSVSSGCDPQALNRRVVELEFELREAKERLRMQHEGDIESLFRKVKSERKFDDLPATLAAYEQELRDANERIQNSEEEIKRLQNELSRFNGAAEDEGIQVLEEDEATSQDPDLKIQALTEALRVTRIRLHDAEKRIAILNQELDNKSKTTDQKLKSLQDELESLRKEAVTWKNKSNADRREVVKMQDRISMLKSSLAGRDHEIRDLKVSLADAEEKIFPEKSQIKAEISKLLEERKVQEEEMKELETRVRCLESEIRNVSNEKKEAEERMKSEMAEKESCIESISERVSKLESEREELREEIVGLRSEVSGRAKRIEEMEEEMERQRKKTEEVAEEKREVIRQLCFSLDYLRDEFMGLRRAFAEHRPRNLPILAS